MKWSSLNNNPSHRNSKRKKNNDTILNNTTFYVIKKLDKMDQIYSVHLLRTLREIWAKSQKWMNLLIPVRFDLANCNNFEKRWSYSAICLRREHWKTFYNSRVNILWELPLSTKITWKSTYSFINVDILDDHGHEKIGK